MTRALALVELPEWLVNCLVDMLRKGRHALVLVYVEEDGDRIGFYSGEKLAEEDIQLIATTLREGKRKWKVTGSGEQPTGH